MFYETDPAALFADADAADTIAIELVAEGKADDLNPDLARWAKACGFRAKAGQWCAVADGKGGIDRILATLDKGPLAFGGLANSLPQGSYRLPDDAPNQAALSWAMGGYEFTRYRAESRPMPQLAVTLDSRERALAQSVFIARDLINIPANDMGPDALETAFRTLASEHGADVTVTVGDDTLSGFPMLHAVGRASAQAPRVLDMVWGAEDAPKVTLVGKGVTFDTGGLNIKSGATMGLMKKDMGGAANVMALAHAIMARRLPVRLRLIVGAVENCIAGNAFRPGDILPSRKGITVEIGNTDAEGRLVLGDCLALADEEQPHLLVDMATLTGAARVALGPQVMPFYAHDDGFAADLAEASTRAADPLWRMPLWDGYRSMLSSKIADVNHISTGGFAGSITAALFLDRFVEKAATWAHFDIYGWVPTALPHAPVGGEAQAIRALFDQIERTWPAG